MKDFNYKLQYWLAIGFKHMIMLLPEKLRFKIAEIMALTCYKFMKKRRIISLENISLAFPDMPLDAREHIAKESIKIVAKSFISSLWYDKYFENPDNVKYVNRELIDELMSRGKGMLGATIHMGNQDMTAKVVEEGKYGNAKFVAVAKRLKNPYINKFITESREKHLGCTIIQKSASTGREIVRALKAGCAIGLLSDQRDKGTNVTFFGKETTAPTGVMSIALKYDAPVVFAYTILNPDNTCTIVVDGEIPLTRTGNFKHDVQINTQNLYHKMEEVIRKHPEQWMWVHDRWDIYREKYEHKEKRK